MATDSSGSSSLITFARILREIEQKGLHSISDWLIEYERDLHRHTEGREYTVHELLEEIAVRWNIMSRTMQEGQEYPLQPLVSLRANGHGLAYTLAHNPHRGVLLGDVGNTVIWALALSEGNISGKCIVPLPTGGACGIVGPTIQMVIEQLQPESEKVLRGLMTAIAIQTVIATNASVAGAQHGCQAEIGSAAAMAAGAAVEIISGEPRKVIQAVAMALQYFLGLVCDPVAGLVEIPCIFRNAPTPLVALTYAWMAIEGIEFLIPADEVIEAMDKIGRRMPCPLKETGRGGLAGTPTGIRSKKALFATYTRRKVK